MTLQQINKTEKSIYQIFGNISHSYSESNERKYTVTVQSHDVEIYLDDSNKLRIHTDDTTSQDFKRHMVIAVKRLKRILSSPIILGILF